MRSKRGVGGGYLLARRPETIRSSEIIRVIEGPVTTAELRKGAGKSAAEESSPAVSRLVRETSEAIGEVLDRWTLADLAREEQEAEERKARNVIYHI